MNGKKRGLIFGAIITLVVSGMFLAFLVSEPIVNKIVEDERIVMESRVPTLVPLGDNDPGDNSGFFYYMVYPNQGDPGTAYASNLSNDSAAGGAYEFSDVGNTTCNNETPYSTTFDLVLKVGVTNEDGYWTANQTRNPGYNWLLLTCADLSIGADTNMSVQFIGNTTGYAWYHYYLNNSGLGYTITEGQSFNVTSAKYFVQRIV